MSLCEKAVITMPTAAPALSVLLEEPAYGVSTLEEHWDRAGTFAYLPQKSPVSREWVQEALGSLPEPYREDHFCLLTSGSTGSPKLVIGRKDRAECLAGVLHQVQESHPVAETIVTLPLSYCYAFVNQWLWSRVARRRLVMTPGLSQPDVLLANLRNARDAMLCLVGPQVALLLRVFGDERFPGVLRVHFAGGRFPQERLPGLRAMFPNARIFNNYGCAEAMPRLTLRPAEDAAEASDIGRPLPGVQLKTGGSGELLFLSEYRGVAQVDASGCRVIPDDEWIASGDLARQEPSGHWQLLGRAGEVFKRYGEKIALAQILATVSEHWQGQANCYRDRDAAGEEGYVLVLCPGPGQEAVRQLLQAFRARHPRTHWPLRIESTEALPLLPNGKVDGFALPDLADKSLHWRQRI
jgi:acyl-CoA synthetase (AMP-forming)/AMP-acid ligase II